MLFTGIMLTPDGPKVLEYNARFGDPETQTMMMLLAPECDLAAVLLACCAGTLDAVSIPVRPGFACNVVVAAGGYPESYPKGDVITLGECPEGGCLHSRGQCCELKLTGGIILGVQVFHAGTERSSSGELTTAGGRVLSVAAYGTRLQEAVASAYKGVERVRFSGMFYRKDIAKRYDCARMHVLGIANRCPKGS